MSVDLERKVIRSIIETGDLATFLRIGADVNWFSDLQAKQAFSVIQDYAQSPDTAGKVPGIEYMQERVAMPASLPGNADHRKPEDTTLQLSQAFRLHRLRRLVKDAWIEAEAVLLGDPEAAHQKLLEQLTGREISALRSGGRKTILGQIAHTLFERYKTSTVAEGITGVLTPYDALTYVTKGWNRGELYCLFAPPKSLKSWNMLNFALKAWQTCPDKHVLFVTSEMPAEQLASRLVCMIYQWDFNAYRDRTIPEPIIQQMLKVDLNNRFHFYQPAGRGLQALAEVRNVIAELNMQGGVSLVLWDGHYRSAASEEYEDIYELVRRTRALALEIEVDQPTIIITAQEGSKPGAPTHKAYRQEASLMMYTSKVSPDTLLFQTTDVREGPSLEMEIKVDFSRTSFTQAEAQVEGKESEESPGAWV